MPNVPIRDTGKYGLNKDVSPVLLPPNGWSDGRNIRFDNGSVSKISGHQSVLTLDSEAHNLIFWPRPVAPAYVFADAATVKSVAANGTITNRNKKGTDAYNAAGRWHSSLFNGGYTVVLNNTVQTPQYITYNDSETLQDLTAWPSGYTAGVLRSYKNVLVAGNVSASATDIRPGSILVSSQASPGAIPASWTVGDVYDTGTADEFELSQTQPVLDIVDLRGSCMIFTGDSIHRMTLASGGGATRVDDLNRSRGILATDCVKEFNGQLFVVDKNDVYVTSGSGQTQSVIDEYMKDYFYGNLNETHYENTFVVNNLHEDEMWICYPTTSSEGPCNEALIYNYLQNTWSIRDLPNTNAATNGFLPRDDVYQQNREGLLFTGYRFSEASREQSTVASGTGSNVGSNVAAAFDWTLTGTSNATVVGVNEVQTLTITGSQQNTPADSDIQSFTLTGRSNSVAADNTEVVDFGFDSDFNSGGPIRTTADYIDYTFSSTTLSGSTTGFGYGPERNDLDGSWSGTTFTDTDFSSTAEMIGLMVKDYNSGNHPNDTIGTASLVGNNTFRITIEDNFSDTLISGDNRFQVRVFGSSFSGLTGSLSITSSFFSDTFTDSAIFEGDDSATWNINNSVITGGDAQFYGVGNFSTSAVIGNSGTGITNTAIQFDTDTIGGANARSQLKTALAANSSFTSDFTFDTDTEIAAIERYIDLKIVGTLTNSFTTATSGSFTVSSGFADPEQFRFGSHTGLFLSGTNNSTAATISNAEDLVDYVIANVPDSETSTGNTGRLYASKVGSDTIRIRPTSDSPSKLYISNFFISAIDSLIGIYAFDDSGGLADFSGLSIEVSVEGANESYAQAGTTNGNLVLNLNASPGSALLNTRIRTANIFAARYRSNSDSDFSNFSFTVSRKQGVHTLPYLDVVQEGSLGTIPATMYTLTDGGGTEVTSFSSSVSDPDDNDRASVLNRIESFVDSNNETPINYTASASGDVVTLTADEDGVSEGNWTLVIDHGSASGNSRGNMAATHRNVTTGRNVGVASVAYTLTDPVADTEYVTTLTGNQSANQIAASLSNLTVPGWTLTNSGATVVFTGNSEAPVGSLWAYSDVETNNNQSVSGAVVETTNGVRPVPGTTMTLVDGTRTLVSVTIPASNAADAAGAVIAAANSVEGDFTYNTTNDRLTFTYDDFGMRSRPVLTINNPTPGTGTLAVASIGNDSAGSSVDDVLPSEYTVTLPSGFTPATLEVSSRNETRSEVLFRIRDAINSTTFTPVNISAAVVGSALLISWADYTIAANARIAIAVDNQSGNGSIAFATATEVDIDHRSLELHAADRGNTFNGELFTAYVERKNLNVGDLEATKWNRTVYPLMTGTGDVTIFVRGTGKAGALPTLDATGAERRVFDIDEDYKIDPRQNGRFVNIRFETTDGNSWTLDGYSLNVDVEDYR